MKQSRPVRWPVKEQELLDLFARDGIKPSSAARSIARLAPQLSRSELEEFRDWAEIYELASATPEQRREILSTMDTCPCCDRWLGHNNNPPPDDPPVQLGKSKPPLSLPPAARKFKPPLR